MTYNLINPSTQYQNGLDAHLDTGASYFLTKQLNVGLVGYYFQQVTGATARERGSVDSKLASLGLGRN
jgi:hypothetical protein